MNCKDLISADEARGRGGVRSVPPCGCGPRREEPVSHTVHKPIASTRAHFSSIPCGQRLGEATQDLRTGSVGRRCPGPMVKIRIRIIGVLS